MQMAKDEHISPNAYHRGYFLFLQPMREPIFSHPSQLFILFIFMTFCNLITQTNFWFGDLFFICFRGGKVGKVNYVSRLSSDLPIPLLQPFKFLKYRQALAYLCFLIV